MLIKKPKNRPGQGRKPLALGKRRETLAVRIKPETATAIWNYCETHQMSAGELLDKIVSGEISVVPKNQNAKK